MPRITLAVLAYRQPEFVEGAVRSALAQIGESIEIVLSDDCSPDDTYDRMARAAAHYQGPHQVVLRRNATNLGIGGHINEVVEASCGDLIVMMAADDLSTPDRVQRLTAAWRATGEQVDLVASHVHDMSFDGRLLGEIHVDDLSRWHDLHDWSRGRPYVIGAAHAVTRRLFKRFGPYRAGVSHEDQVNTLRALATGGAITVDAALVHYRRGGISGAAQDRSPMSFLARMRRRNTLHLALHEQWLADARLVDQEPIVREGFAQEHLRESFVQSQLNANTWQERWEAIRGAPQLPLTWRLRRAIDMRLPRLAIARQSARAQLLRLREGLSGASS